MSTAEVVGVGNAIVDVIAQVDDSFITDHELNRGSMTLIDEPRAELLTGLMPPGLKESGGSAANTMVGVASFGQTAAYIGKVRNDALGEVFMHDIREAGVGFDVKQAIRHAMGIAKEHGVMTSLTLSDPFAVDRHREEWLDLIADRVDLLFGNRDEVHSLLGTQDRSEIITRLRDMAETTCVTMGHSGSMIITPTEVLEIPVVEVDERVDTTGAGDLYAAGVLAGLAQGQNLDVVGRMGSCAAAEVITHIGARPMQALSSLC